MHDLPEDEWLKDLSGLLPNEMESNLWPEPNPEFDTDLELPHYPPWATSNYEEGPSRTLSTPPCSTRDTIADGKGDSNSTTHMQTPDSDSTDVRDHGPDTDGSSRDVVPSNQQSHDLFALSQLDLLKSSSLSSAPATALAQPPLKRQRFESDSFVQAGLERLPGKFERVVNLKDNPGGLNVHRKVFDGCQDYIHVYTKNGKLPVLHNIEPPARINSPTMLFLTEGDNSAKTYRIGLLDLTTDTHAALQKNHTMTAQIERTSKSHNEQCSSKEEQTTLEQVYFDDSNQYRKGKLHFTLSVRNSTQEHRENFLAVQLRPRCAKPLDFRIFNYRSDTRSYLLDGSFHFVFTFTPCVSSGGSAKSRVIKSNKFTFSETRDEAKAYKRFPKAATECDESVSCGPGLRVSHTCGSDNTTDTGNADHQQAISNESSGDSIDSSTDTSMSRAMTALDESESIASADSDEEQEAALIAALSKMRLSRKRRVYAALSDVERRIVMDVDQFDIRSVRISQASAEYLDHEAQNSSVTLESLKQTTDWCNAVSATARFIGTKHVVDDIQETKLHPPLNMLLFNDVDIRWSELLSKGVRPAQRWLNNLLATTTSLSLNLAQLHTYWHSFRGATLFDDDLKLARIYAVREVSPRSVQLCQGSIGPATGIASCTSPQRFHVLRLISSDQLRDSLLLDFEDPMLILAHFACLTEIPVSDLQSWVLDPYAHGRAEGKPNTSPPTLTLQERRRFWISRHALHIVEIFASCVYRHASSVSKIPELYQHLQHERMVLQTQLNWHVPSSKCFPDVQQHP